MVSTSSNNRNRETKTAVSSLKPTKNKANPIFAQIVNLLYLHDGNNLAAVVLQDNSTGNLYTLSAEPDLNAKLDTIQIDNLRDFQFRLQDIFNHDSLVSIYYENNRIKSLVVIKQGQVSVPGGPADRVGRRSACELPPNFC